MENFDYEYKEKRRNNRMDKAHKVTVMIGQATISIILSFILVIAVNGV